MDKLLSFLNSLASADQAEFAARCSTSVGYLRKAISKGQRLGASLCAAAERESAGAVTRRDLRPDDWRLIWPELAAQEAANA